MPPNSAYIPYVPSMEDDVKPKKAISATPAASTTPGAAAKQQEELDMEIDPFFAAPAAPATPLPHKEEPKKAAPGPVPQTPVQQAKKPVTPKAPIKKVPSGTKKSPMKKPAVQKK